MCKSIFLLKKIVSDNLLIMVVKYGETKPENPYKGWVEYGEFLKHWYHIRKV